MANGQPDSRQAGAMERIADILALIADKIGVDVPDGLFPNVSGEPEPEAEPAPEPPAE